MLISIGHSDLLAYLLQLQLTSEYANICIFVFIFISVEGRQPVSPVGLVADYALTVNLGVIIMKSGSLGPGQLNHPFMVVCPRLYRFIARLSSDFCPSCEFSPIFLIPTPRTSPSAVLALPTPTKASRFCSSSRTVLRIIPVCLEISYRRANLIRF